MNFSGKSILITGASSGLGEHFSRLFCADGAHVIMAARSIGKLERISREIQDAGGSVSLVEMDVANALSVAQAFDTLESRLDVVINNAGIDGAAPALTVSPEQFDSVLDTNLKGTFYVAQQAAQ